MYVYDRYIRVLSMQMDALQYNQHATNCLATNTQDLHWIYLQRPCTQTHTNTITVSVRIQRVHTRFCIATTRTTMESDRMKMKQRKRKKVSRYEYARLAFDVFAATRHANVLSVAVGLRERHTRFRNATTRTTIESERKKLPRNDRPQEIVQQRIRKTRVGFLSY